MVGSSQGAACKPLMTEKFSLQSTNKKWWAACFYRLKRHKVKMSKLTATQIKSLAKQAPKKHTDGGGLYF